METWGIWYIDVDFFVCPRGINLMNLSTESVQLILSLLYIFTWCLFHVRVCILTTRFSVHAFDLDLSIHACLSLTPRSIHHTTCWEVLTPWTCMFRSWSLDHGGLPGDQSCVAVASWISSWPSLALSFQAPCSSLEFFFYNLWASFVLFILYIYLYSRICTYRWCNILIILCHILW